MRSAFSAWLRLVRAFLHDGALLLAGRAVSRRPPTAHRGLFIHLFTLNVLTLALGSALRSWPLTVMQLVATVLLAALFLVACVRLCEYPRQHKGRDGDVPSAGFTHGPHPKAFAAGAKFERKETDEVAVMIATRDALDPAPEAEGIEDRAYVDSWRGAR